jgi:hypothetical protein
MVGEVVLQVQGQQHRRATLTLLAMGPMAQRVVQFATVPVRPVR